jgi:hypothetical protein
MFEDCDTDDKKINKVLKTFAEESYQDMETDDLKTLVKLMQDRGIEIDDEITDYIAEVD